jgi:hypothetical protein
MRNLDLVNNKHVFAHRGLWGSSVPQNSLSSFQLAVENGFSIETDIRHQNGALVTSHDLKSGIEPFHPVDLTNFHTPFALNLKEDGLQELLINIRDWIEISHSFVFDGSLPQMYLYRKLGIPHGLRMSEFERVLPWKSDVIWLDSFESDWWIIEKDFEMIEDSDVVVVSPELHGRDPRHVWDFLANQNSLGRKRYSICTDQPLGYLAWL